MSLLRAWSVFVAILFVASLGALATDFPSPRPFSQGRGGGSSLPADNVTGSGGAGEVTYWNGVHTITGDADFVFDPVLRLLVLASTTGQVAMRADSPSIIDLQDFGATPNPRVSIGSGRGTLTAPTATQNGDKLGTILYEGTGSTLSGYVVAAVQALATQAFTDASLGARLSLQTVPAGGAPGSMVERVTLSSEETRFNDGGHDTNFTIASSQLTAFEVDGQTSARIALESDGDIAIDTTLGGVAGAITLSADGDLFETTAGDFYIATTAAAPAGNIFIQALNGSGGDITIETNGGHFELVGDGEAASVVSASNNELHLDAADGIVLINGSDLILTGASNEVLGHQSTAAAPPRWRVPSIIAASAGSLPACDATNAGNIFYSDDTDDAARGELCVCSASAGGVYSNVIVGTSTACPDP